MPNRTKREMKLAQLAEESGVPLRTIRLYIAKGLVPPPRRPGRDAAYGTEHLDALRHIRAGQRAGLTLERIRHELTADAPASPLPEPGSWWEYLLAPDIRVSIRGDVSGRRLKKIREAVSLLHAELGSGDLDATKESST